MSLEDILGDTPEVHKLIQELNQICSWSWRKKTKISNLKPSPTGDFWKSFENLPLECFD